MDPVIVQVAASLDIAAPPASVFRFLCDADAKARLNPSVQVIRIERETPGPLHVGSITFFRVQKGRRIFEYRMRCVRFEPDRLIESTADLPTLFTVRVGVEGGPNGSRLTQTERCEIAPEMLEGLPGSRRAELAWKLVKILAMVAPELAHETCTLVFRRRADSLRDGMQRELLEWLRAIKAHLERAERLPAPAAAGS